MSDRYNVRLSKQETKMMKAWDRLDPISSWERTKNKRVQKLQGNNNKYIQ